MTKFNHNDKVTAIIDGTEILDARISIDKDGTPFICQNEKDGADAENKLGYMYSWELKKNFMTFGWEVSNLRLADETKYQKGMVLVNEDGDESMVLETLGCLVFLSGIDAFEESAGALHEKELDKRYTIKDTDPEVSSALKLLKDKGIIVDGKVIEQ